jgi:hypothetical protein
MIATGPGIYNTDGGCNAQWVSTWPGPSLGWSLLPVQPELIVTVPGALIVPAFASRVLLRAAATPITLPSVKAWVQAQGANGLVANTAAFDRSIWVKDLGGVASVGSPIVINAAGGDTIDGLGSYQITTPFELIRLYVLTTADGWYRG